MMRILVAEDDRVSRQLLSRILAPYGSADSVEDGQAAVDAFEKAWDDGNPYKLVCLDIMMPVMNGLEALIWIRSFEDRYQLKEDERTFVVMTTALGDEENFLRAHSAGSEWYLTKPVDKEKLRELMVELGLAV